ncbi:MAG: poly-gamma-glutamate synthase PgsB [Firmicutes bacterium]|nr:poly-gamma-glutamate synthase PgsB [Bacillota bacterium]
MEIWPVLALTFILVVLGILEHALHQHNLRKIPIRIHVNGTRGKSTTTRLIAGVLREGGYVVVAKTTGTAPRLILEDGSEEPILRRRKASIIEQVRIVREAAKREADVLVVECMAVHPEMQWVAEKRILHSTIGVITNAREDHLDVMGPTRGHVAETLALAIPRRGRLVVGEEEFIGLFKEEAEKLGTATYLAPASLGAQDLERFPYMMFRENVACALKVGELLAVPEEVAWAGMLKATPDIGSTTIYSLEHVGVTIYFVNALAANDRTSTLLVWDRWQELAAQLGLERAPVVGLMHNRWDRSFRVPELATLATTDLPLKIMLLTGDLVPVTKRHLRKHGFNPRAIGVVEKPTPQKVTRYLSNHYQGAVVLFAYGNTQGFGQELADFFRRNGVQVPNDHTSDGVRSSS